VRANGSAQGGSHARYTGLRSELISTLRKRLGRPKGDMTFRNETELDRLARESIRFGRMAGKSDRSIDYGTLHDRWKVGKAVRQGRPCWNGVDRLRAQAVGSLPQSVKFVRNALAVRCVERGTVRRRVARRDEVAQGRHPLWPAATGRLP
jgi:hypothetical protein